jgi:2-haloalkanoic acid dehalogenase type II
MHLADFTTLSFDCYGTLIDWETGIWSALQPLVAGSAAGRDEALAAFAVLESSQQRTTPSMGYRQVLERVHHGLAARFGLETAPSFDKAFGGSVGAWPAFPDSVEALRALSQHYRLVILSNVDKASLAASRQRLGVAFDAEYTAEEIGSYKPDPANFHHMLERLMADHGVEPGALLHVAQSQFHDHVPAQRLGLATAWIDRQHLSRGGSWGATVPVDLRPDVDFTFLSLAELAEAATRHR